MTDPADEEDARWLMVGGWNYSGPIPAPAACESLKDAALAWYDRYSSNGHRRIDGVFWPCWGDMNPDDYAVVDVWNDEAMTRDEVFQLVEEVLGA